ncbi:MAG: DUF6873 family GME fold protein [Bacteroidota bacterium]
MKCIIVDERASDQTKHKLSEYGNVIEFPMHSHVYSPISAHPDIFMCLIDNQLIVSPSVNPSFIKQLKHNNINFIFGNKSIGSNHPDTVGYNVVITKDYIIHNPKYTDRKIFEATEARKTIAVKQFYTRCSLICIENNKFLTSDEGIFKTLEAEGLSVLKVSTNNITLKGLTYGLFGGCCGISENILFINGSISKLDDSLEIIDFIKSEKTKIIELQDDFLEDIGGIFFVKNIIL